MNLDGVKPNPTGETKRSEATGGPPSKPTQTAEFQHLLSSALQNQRGFPAVGAPATDSVSPADSAGPDASGPIVARSPLVLSELLRGYGADQGAAAGGSSKSVAGADAASKTTSSADAISKARGAAETAPAAWSSTRVPSGYQEIINQAAERYQLDPALIAGVIETESSFNARAVSPAGAKGLMQLMDQTARGLGVRNSLDPADNVFGGAKLLRQLLDRYHGNVSLALAAYNAGPGAVDRYGGVPPYPETQRYVPRVLAAVERQRASTVSAGR
jgi:soluble lytic murein transglycosylase-like protein